MTRTTKHKSPAGWSVRFDGQLTGLSVVKGDPPGYREAQMWDVLDGPDGLFLFSANSLGAAMERLDRLFRIAATIRDVAAIDGQESGF